LGATFCNIDPSKLSDANLNAKPQNGAIGKPNSKKPKLVKDSEAGPSKKVKATSKKAKKPNKDAKDLDIEAGPSKGAKN
jgi:hypothetical protein